MRLLVLCIALAGARYVSCSRSNGGGGTGTLLDGSAPLPSTSSSKDEIKVGHAWSVAVSHAGVLKLGNKFRLSGIGDAAGNDNWLRLFDVGNRGFYGGFAASKLWAQHSITSTLSLGNKWKLSAVDNNGDTGSWLRLAGKDSPDLYGGFAAKHLFSEALQVNGTARVNGLHVGGRWRFAPVSDSDSWIQLSSIAESSKAAGLSVNRIRGEEVSTAKLIVSGSISFGEKWKLTASGSSLVLVDAKTGVLTGGFSAASLMGTELTVKQTARVGGDSFFAGKATFQDSVHVTKNIKFDSASGRVLQIGGCQLSGKGQDRGTGSWVHILEQGKETYASAAVKALWGSMVHTDKLQLGHKWQLSGVGDGHKNDHWLRLMSSDGNKFSGGFAAQKLWATKGLIHVLQLGNRFRLSGIGDSGKSDDWLRLYNTANTGLFGGFEAAKMRTRHMDADGIKTRSLTIGSAKLYEHQGFIHFSGSGGLSTRSLKTGALSVTKHAKIGSLSVQGLIQGKSVIAEDSIQIARWRLGEYVKDKKTADSNAWLALTSSKDPSQMQNLQLGKLKSIDVEIKGLADMKEAKAAKLKAASATIGELFVTDKVRVASELWVGNHQVSVQTFERMEQLIQEVQELKQLLAAK